MNLESASTTSQLTQSEPDLEGFKLHADGIIIQTLYPLLRKAEFEYGVDRQKAACYVADQMMRLLAVYLGVDISKIDQALSESK